MAGKIRKSQPAKPARPPTTAQRLDAIGIEVICEKVADCVTLQRIADEVGISKGSLITWLSGHADQYARAREAQADVLAEDLLAIADEDTATTRSMGDGVVDVVFDSTAVARNRLRVDARKWLAGKMNSKKYGDRTVLAGDEDAPIRHDISGVLAQIREAQTRLGLNVIDVTATRVALGDADAPKKRGGK